MNAKISRLASSSVIRPMVNQLGDRVVVKTALATILVIRSHMGL
jgi:hypothetical protein